MRAEFAPPRPGFIRALLADAVFVALIFAAPITILSLGG